MNGHAASSSTLSSAGITPQELFEQVLFARQRVYRFAQPTPVQTVQHPCRAMFRIKREDLSPIHSYKWRGAMNCMAALSESGDTRHIVASSAGNHGQGVAAVARMLHRTATIFMPRSTPALKIREVRRVGGNAVEVILVGDSVDESLAPAIAQAENSNAVIIPPFDDLHVIAGQGTIGDGSHLLPVLTAGDEFDIA